MFVTLHGERYDFHKVDIIVIEQGIHNLFESFDKKTLHELINQKKYEQLKPYIEENYMHLLKWPAGKAIMHLKDMGNGFYKQFLNNYGDLAYSRFFVEGDEQLLRNNGVYTVIVDDELMFCGVCARSFKERFNQHLGTIYAKGCFRDGTATHCHINAKITQKINSTNVHFAIYPMEDKHEIQRLKNAIIKRFEPEWNLRSNKDTPELFSLI